MNKEIDKENSVIRKEEKLNFDPNSRWARVFVAPNNLKESKEAFDILMEAGFHVTAMEVEGIMGPELRIRREIYRGLDQIKMFVETEKKANPKPE
ncbi:hypothetical protein HKBW3S42_01384 [Candidatus Hakubella thermalkaliphila]|uniref:Uncharacterized protein n=1 Tax=Candidatus Hakubella thermalkaliphila TaxID=2754717 RepID=A0A6V8PQJ4_9ACTN|nr:hypothetical protein HKBW3S42_01384 [Candidatus Hakubella thermalkaliphila]